MDKTSSPMTPSTLCGTPTISILGSEISQMDILYNKSLDSKENQNSDPITPQETKSVKSLKNLGASNNSLVPVNIPNDIANDDNEDDDDYHEMYHTSMGHLYTVKTKDMEL